MKQITEYLSTKVAQTKIKATNETIYSIVISELDRLGYDANLNHIDVSEVTDMDSLFSDCADRYKDINPDISKWNVTNVHDMRYMFEGCEKFNCDISGWNVSNVEFMMQIFRGCKNFNQDLSQWNVRNVKYMQGMFYECKNFNQDLSQWDIRKVKDRRYMFEECPIKEEFKPKFKI